MYLPLRGAELGLSPASVALVLSWNRWTRIVSEPLLERLFGFAGHKAALPIAVVLAAATTAAYSIPGSLFFWLVLRSMWGLEFAFLRYCQIRSAIPISGSSFRSLSVGNALQETGHLAAFLIGAGLLHQGVEFHAILGLFSCLGAGAVFLTFGLDARTDWSFRPSAVNPRTPLKNLVVFPCSRYEWVALFLAASYSAIPFLLPDTLRGSVESVFLSASLILAFQRASHIFVPPVLLWMFPGLGAPLAYRRMVPLLALIWILFAFGLPPPIAFFLIFNLSAIARITGLSLALEVSAREHGTVISRLTHIHDLGLAIGPFLGALAQAP